jgi:hypothetical protein
MSQNRHDNRVPELTTVLLLNTMGTGADDMRNQKAKRGKLEKEQRRANQEAAKALTEKKRHQEPAHDLETSHSKHSNKFGRR